MSIFDLYKLHGKGAGCACWVGFCPVPPALP